MPATSVHVGDVFAMTGMETIRQSEHFIEQPFCVAFYVLTMTCSVEGWYLGPRVTGDTPRTVIQLNPLIVEFDWVTVNELMDCFDLGFYEKVRFRISAVHP